MISSVADTRSSTFYAYLITKPGNCNLNPNRTGLFDIFGLGGGGGGAELPPIIFVVYGPIATKFCTEIQEKGLHKINDVIDNDVIIVNKLAENSKESK